MRRSSPRQAGESELIALAAQGDREAFGTLYERYVLRVLRHIYFLTSDVHLAEDLTAQTFLKALEAIPRYEVRGAPFLAWLLRIATNITVNHRKARANGNAHLPEIVEATGVCYSPEDSCEAKVDAQRVWEGVRRLRRDQRQVIVMRFVDGLSYPDIAQLLGKSIGAVRVIQFRALASLRHMLDEEEEQRLPAYARSRAG